MHLCVVSIKECWQGKDGAWYSSGGFPLQMGAIGSLFDSMTLFVGAVPPRGGAIPLPLHARVISTDLIPGKDLARKLWFARHFFHHLFLMIKEIGRSDAVHIPLPGDLGFLGYVVALALRKPLIVRYGGSWTANSETTMWNRITRTLMRLSAGGRRVTLVAGAGSISPAPGMHWLFATAISRAEVESVAVDLNRVPEKHLRLAYVGRLSSEKGVIYLIRAMGLLRQDPELRDRLPRLSILGDGPQREELVQAACDEQVSDMITFEGQLDRPLLLQALRATDLCVIPSLTEGFGKARLDAMVCATPVLTTEAGPARAIVGEDGERGWVCKVGDAGALAERIKRTVLEPPDWPSLRSRCRAFALSHTLEAWAEQIGAHCARQWDVQFKDGRLG